MNQDKAKQVTKDVNLTRAAFIKSIKSSLLNRWVDKEWTVTPWDKGPEHCFTVRSCDVCDDAREGLRVLRRMEKMGNVWQVPKSYPQQMCSFRSYYVPKYGPIAQKELEDEGYKVE